MKLKDIIISKEVILKQNPNLSRKYRKIINVLYCDFNLQISSDIAEIKLFSLDRIVRIEHRNIIHKFDELKDKAGE